MGQELRVESWKGGSWLRGPGPVPSRAAGCCDSVAGGSWPGWSRGCSSWSSAAAWRKVGVCSPSARGTPAPSSLPPAEAGGWSPVPAGHPLLLSPDCIRIARCFEATRQRCCRLEQDGRRAREQLARVEAERAALEVKLKHARNQVEVEMKKRHRAEAELEKQVRGWLQGCPAGLLRGPRPAHHRPVALAGAQTAAGP